MRVYLIGELKEIRVEKGFSREKLAIKIKNLCKHDFRKKSVSTKTIQRAEEGRPIKKENAAYIAKALNMNLEDIIRKQVKNTNEESCLLHLEKCTCEKFDLEVINEKKDEPKQLEFELANNEKIVLLIGNNNKIEKIISTIKQDINDIQCLCGVNTPQNELTW